MPARMPVCVALGVAWLALSGARGCSDLGGGAPGHACTEMACVDHAVVVFDPPLDQPGMYIVTVAADAEIVECEVKVPGVILPETCSSDRVTIDPPRTFIERAGKDRIGSIIIEGPGIAGLEWTGSAPGRISIEIRRDGLEVLQTDLLPSYQPLFVNGPDCPGICQEAIHTVPTR